MAGSAETPRALFRSAEGEARFVAAYDAMLKTWPVAYEELDAPTHLGATHVVASGPKDAPALLLLPSLAASAMLWRPNVGALSARFRVYAVDVIGQVGKSAPPLGPIRTRRDMARWMSGVMDGLGVSRASLIGSSYGGFLAVSQALLTPERVDRLVLISPAATFVGFSWSFYYAMMIRGPLVRLLRRWRKRPATRMPGGMTIDPNDGGWGALMSVTMAESGRPTVLNPNVFTRAELRSIRAPTLLLIGEREVLYEPERTLRLAKSRMNGLTGAVIPGAGHLAALERPDEVNARMLAFLTSPREVTAAVVAAGDDAAGRAAR